MACNQCFHRNVCGSSSAYSDSSACKTFVDKDSVVSIDILHNVQDKCEELRERCRDLATRMQGMSESKSCDAEELRYLRIVKQTLEMCSGRKFDFYEGE